MCMWVHARGCAHTHAHAWVHVCAYIRAYARARARACVHVCVRMRVRVRVHLLAVPAPAQHVAASWQVVGHAHSVPVRPAGVLEEPQRPFGAPVPVCACGCGCVGVLY
jgi:hypothetical protein